MALGDWSAALDGGALACWPVGIEPDDGRLWPIGRQLGEQAAAAAGIEHAAPRGGAFGEWPGQGEQVRVGKASVGTSSSDYYTNGFRQYPQIKPE